MYVCRDIFGHRDMSIERVSYAGGVPNQFPSLV
jgi:hypothetical protein